MSAMGPRGEHRELQVRRLRLQKAALARSYGLLCSKRGNRTSSFSLRSCAFVTVPIFPCKTKFEPLVSSRRRVAGSKRGKRSPTFCILVEGYYRTTDTPAGRASTRRPNQRSRHFVCTPSLRPPPLPGPREIVFDKNGL